MISAFGVEHGEISKRKADPKRDGKVFGSPAKTAGVVGTGAAILVGRKRAGSIGSAVGNRMVRRSMFSAERVGSMKSPKLIDARTKYATKLHEAGSAVRRTDDTKEITGHAVAGLAAGGAAGGAVYGRKRLTAVRGQ